MDQNLGDINNFQQDIMRFIDWWASEIKTPIPRAKIIAEMKNEYGINSSTTINSLKSLLRKGYLRTAVKVKNKTRYIQLRRI